ncbi:MAG: gamma-glutamyltransferase [Verrucomicrobiota bacterium]
MPQIRYMGERRLSGMRLCETRGDGTVLAMRVIVIGFLVWVVAMSGGYGQGALSWPAVGEEGMVTARNVYGAETGLEILKGGGNAVDAAVAVAYALAVTLPSAGNIGGGGFLVYYDADEGDVFALDFREMAPKRATRDLFLGEGGEVDVERARYSHLSAGVPGSVAGLSAMLERFGTMELAEVMAPAIRYAEEGAPVTAQQARALRGAEGELRKWASSRAVFFGGDGEPLEAGEALMQPDLATSLRAIAGEGPPAFYEGAIAELIVAEMEENGGLITMEDLAGYEVKWREPVRGTYRGLTVCSMPPPSSGGIHLVQMLNVIEGFALRETGWQAAESIHLMAETMRRAYADRSQFLGDADFFDVPVEELMWVDYAEQLRGSIDRGRASASEAVRPGSLMGKEEGTQTTTLAVIDAAGNAVSLTTTLNTAFGSGIVVAGAGFLLNNEMDDFSAKPGVPNIYGLVGGEANRIEAGKRPLSSMTPTIVLREGEPYLITGGVGGSRIITSVLQVIVNVVDYDLNVQEAVGAPRFHHQWLPDRLSLEKEFSVDTIRLLEAMGHEVSVDAPASNVVAIEVVTDEGGERRYEGAADPRREGAALGF